MLYSHSTSSATNRWTTPRIVMQSAVVLGIGLATGFLTLIGQRHLPDSVGQFASCYSVWLGASFLCGSLVRTPPWALIGGGIVQGVALAGCYLASFFVLDSTLDTYNNHLYWVIGGLVGGPALGVAGYLWRNGSDRQAVIGSALLGATFISEGIYLVRTLDDEIGWAFTAIGLAVALILPHAARGRTASILLATAVGLALYGGSIDGIGYLNDITG
jgi:hypothetical protein